MGALLDLDDLVVCHPGARAELDALRKGVTEAIAAAVAAERKRWIAPAAVAVQEVANCSGAACQALRAALSIVREYPDFDQGGPLPEMMDQVLRWEPSPMITSLGRLAGPRDETINTPGSPGVRLKN